MYATTLADIFKVFVPSIKDVVILGDVTYGACCVDDYAATALGCDFLVHYGHSCLVPVSMTTCKTLYVFVDILFDEEHLVQSIRKNFPNRTDKIALAGTIQFASAIGKVRRGVAAVLRVLRCREDETFESRGGFRVHRAKFRRWRGHGSEKWRFNGRRRKEGARCNCVCGRR